MGFAHGCTLEHFFLLQIRYWKQEKFAGETKKIERATSFCGEKTWFRRRLKRLFSLSRREACNLSSRETPQSGFDETSACDACATESPQRLRRHSI